MTPLPLQFLMLLVAGWVSRQQQELIEYLQDENRVLREQIGGKRLRFTDAQRCRLARRAQPIGRARLREISTAVTPATLLRWGESPRRVSEWQDARNNRRSQRYGRSEGAPADWSLVRY